MGAFLLTDEAQVFWAFGETARPTYTPNNTAISLLPLSRIGARGLCRYFHPSPHRGTFKINQTPALLIDRGSLSNQHLNFPYVYPSPLIRLCSKCETNYWWGKFWTSSHKHRGLLPQGITDRCFLVEFRCHVICAPNAPSPNRPSLTPLFRWARSYSCLSCIQGVHL